MTHLHNVGLMLAPWIDAAIDKHGGGENIRWESALMPMQEAPDQPPVPVIVVFVWFPGALINMVINGSFQIRNVLSINEEEIDGLMVEFLRQMREARSQQLAAHQKSIADQVHGQNGKVSPGGLHLL